MEYVEYPNLETDSEIFVTDGNFTENKTEISYHEYHDYSYDDMPTKIHHLMYSDTLIVVISLIIMIIVGLVFRWVVDFYNVRWALLTWLWFRQDLLSEAGQAEGEQAESEGRTEAAGRPHEPCDQVIIGQADSVSTDSVTTYIIIIIIITGRCPMISSLPTLPSLW